MLIMVDVLHYIDTYTHTYIYMYVFINKHNPNVTRELSQESIVEPPTIYLVKKIAANFINLHHLNCWESFGAILSQNLHLTSKC